MKLKDIKEFIMKNYKIAIPIMLMLVIFIAFIIYYLVSRVFPFVKVETGSYYQYFGNEKVVYDVAVSKNSKDVITKIEPVGKYVNYDSTPLYSSKKDIVIFPSNMSVVAPIVNCSEYLTKANSYVKYENKRYSLVTNKYNQYLGHYFFYDGEDLYFFIEDIVLVIGDKKIELSPFSYIVANSRKITYYDKVNDKIDTITRDDEDVYVENEYYKIFVTNDYIDYMGQRSILTSDVTVLNTIDEMRRITSE